jgi:hypothetical protein
LRHPDIEVALPWLPSLRGWQVESFRAVHLPKNTSVRIRVIKKTAADYSGRVQGEVADWVRLPKASNCVQNAAVNLPQAFVN